MDDGHLHITRIAEVKGGEFTPVKERDHPASTNRWYVAADKLQPYESWRRYSHPHQAGQRPRRPGPVVNENMAPPILNTGYYQAL